MNVLGGHFLGTADTVMNIKDKNVFIGEFTF